MKRIIIEQEKCRGCKNCIIACMQSHRRRSGELQDLDLQDPENEARHTITMKPGEEAGLESYIPLFCRHCALPECAGACMSGALQKDPSSGLVLYDEKRCGSCFMCVMSCPYGNIKPDKLSGKKIIKCDFCKDYVHPDGREGPNCVLSCPTKAIHVEEVYGGDL